MSRRKEVYNETIYRWSGKSGEETRCGYVKHSRVDRFTCPGKVEGPKRKISKCSGRLVPTKNPIEAYTVTPKVFLRCDTCGVVMSVPEPEEREDWD